MNSRIIYIILVLSLLYGCNEIVLRQSKTFSSVNVDGNLSEWEILSFSSYNKDRVKLGYSKDENYIYIAGITTDKDITRQAASNGLTVWIDPSGNKRKDLEMEVKLPQSKRIDYYKGGFFASLSKEQKKNVLHKIDSLKQGIIVKDKKADKSFRFFERGNNSFAGKLYFTPDTLIFEIKIPITINEVFTSVKPLTDESIFGLSTSINMNEFQENQGPFPAMDGRMKGNGMDRNESYRRPEILEIWFKVRGSGNE